MNHKDLNILIVYLPWLRFSVVLLSCSTTQFRPTPLFKTRDNLWPSNRAFDQAFLRSQSVKWTDSSLFNGSQTLIIALTRAPVLDRILNCINSFHPYDPYPTIYTRSPRGVLSVSFTELLPCAFLSSFVRPTGSMWSSVVGIVTGLEASRSAVRIPEGTREFSGANPASNGYRGPFAWVMRPDHEVNVCCHGVDKAIFTSAAHPSYFFYPAHSP